MERQVLIEAPGTKEKAILVFPSKQLKWSFWSVSK